MYTDKYNIFNNNKIPYSFPYYFDDKHKLKYMESKGVTYDMIYGDTYTLPFQVCCNHQYDTIDIIIYNFRFEQVYKVTCYPDEDGIVYLEVDSIISNDILKRGLYYIQVQSYYCIPGGKAEIKTLIEKEDCILRVR